MSMDPSELYHATLGRLALILENIEGALLPGRPVDVYAQGIFVPLDQPPNPLVAGSTNLYFKEPIDHLLLQNNGSGTVYFALSGVAGVGSLQLVSGASFTIDMVMRSFSVYVTANTVLNDPNNAGLVVLGYR